MNIKKQLEKTITIAELIETLQEFVQSGQYDPETRVAFSSNYGNHGRTEQLHFISGDVEELHVYESAYSETGLAVRNGDGEPTVLVLK